MVELLANKENKNGCKYCLQIKFGAKISFQFLHKITTVSFAKLDEHLISATKYTFINILITYMVSSFIHPEFVARFEK